MTRYYRARPDFNSRQIDRAVSRIEPQLAALRTEARREAELATSERYPLIWVLLAIFAIEALLVWMVVSWLA